jgi:hypothetical protein
MVMKNLAQRGSSDYFGHGGMGALSTMAQRYFPSRGIQIKYLELMKKNQSLLINRNSSRKGKINSRKAQKIRGRIWTALTRIFETFCTQEAPRCISMNATLTTLYLIQKINHGFFVYYISCKEK